MSAPGRRPPTCEALAQVIAGHGEAALLSHLEAYATEHPDDTARLRLLETVAAFGRAAALPFAVDLVRDLDPNWLRTPSLVATWQAALDAMLADAWRPADLRTQWARIPLPLRAPSGRVLVRRGTRKGVSVLLDLAAEARASAPALYGELRRASPILLGRLDPLPVVRRRLKARPAAARAAVATFLGDLGGLDAFATLLPLLEDEDATVRRAASAGLRSLSGVSLGDQPAPWVAWHAAERAWLDGSDLTGRLEADDPVVISRALRELGRHRLVAGAVMASVADLLTHEVVGIRLLACAALRMLGRAEAALALVDALDDEDEGVRQAAWQALKQLSRERHPPDREAWSQARRRWTS
jgi:hypothetical protein